MQPEGNDYLGDWLRIAEKDLIRVRMLLGQHDPDLAGFCLQQGVEKILKAYLLSRGCKLRRIHNLEALLDDTLIFDISFSQFRKICIRISSFYFLERYPSLDVKITENDVQDALVQVTPLIEKIRSSLSSK